MTEGKSVGAVILAGGHGTRMNSSVQKQYMLLGGRPLIAYALEAFDRSAADRLVLVVPPGECGYVRDRILPSCNLVREPCVVEGGKERYHSVYQGLKALEGCDYVLIHDGARPLVTDAVIERAIGGAVLYGACVIGMPVKDTIKIADAEGYASATPDRSRLWQIQTPQAFSYKLVREAYDRLMEDEALQQGITDDAMVVENLAHHPVRLIEGTYENLKVTTPEDMILAEALLKFKKIEKPS